MSPMKDKVSAVETPSTGALTYIFLALPFHAPNLSDHDHCLPAAPSHRIRTGRRRAWPGLRREDEMGKIQWILECATATKFSVRV